jgi:hypothetical protein
MRSADDLTLTIFKSENVVGRQLIGSVIRGRFVGVLITP